MLWVLEKNPARVLYERLGGQLIGEKDWGGNHEFGIQVKEVAYGWSNIEKLTAYTLEHIPREEHATLLRRIHHWLRPKGLLLISTEAADADGVVGQWLGVPMFFSCFDPETVKRLVSEAGFEIVATEIKSQVEQGNEIPYLWLFARKR